MKRYPEEYKEWVVEQMMPPINRSVVELARETGVTTVSLRTWRDEAREQGRVVPGNGKQSDKWSSADKFRVVLETAALSEAELSEYGRRKGIQPEQIRQWRAACEQANAKSFLAQLCHVSHGRLANKLSEAEREAVLAAANEPGCEGLTPHQIVPKLADEGRYLASESTSASLMFAKSLACSPTMCCRPGLCVARPR